MSAPYPTALSTAALPERTICECHECAQQRQWLVIESTDMVMSPGTRIFEAPEDVWPQAQPYPANYLDALPANSLLHFIDRTIDPLFSSPAQKLVYLQTRAVGQCEWLQIFGKVKDTIPYIDEYVNPLVAAVGAGRATEQDPQQANVRVKVGYVQPWTFRLNCRFDTRTGTSFAEGVFHELASSLTNTGEIVDTLEVRVPATDGTFAPKMRVSLLLSKGGKHGDVFDSATFSLDQHAGKSGTTSYVARMLEHGIPTAALKYCSLDLEMSVPIQPGVVPCFPSAVLITFNVTILGTMERRLFMQVPFMLKSPGSGKVWLLSNNFLAQDAPLIVPEEQDQVANVTCTDEELALLTKHGVFLQ